MYADSFSLFFDRMQSFFVASNTCSRKNECVSGNENQERTGSEKILKGSACDACKKFVIGVCRKVSVRWASLSHVEKWTLPSVIAVLMSCLCVYLFSFSEWTVTRGRALDAQLPWIGNGVTISEVSGEWCSSSGDARMSLRAAYYPRVKIVTKDGDGALLVRFKNSQGHFVGDPVSLKVKGGKFVSSSDINAMVEGNSVVVRCEVGFPSRNDFRAHTFMKNEALWAAVVYEKNSEGRITDHPLGVFSIQP